MIDGQQRLTTLYLLHSYLYMPISREALRFEAREKSNRTLVMLNEHSNLDGLAEELVSSELVEGYKVIESYFKTHQYRKEDYITQLKIVHLVRVQVPQGIDLNHYFEIMNTRGEQLELHEIAKAKFLEVLSRDEDKQAAALIWGACANMRHYVQMNIDKDSRNTLMVDDWSELRRTVRDFDDVTKRALNKITSSTQSSLESILNGEVDYDKANKRQEREIESERFESTITFPNFILQVNSVLKKSVDEDTTLDDKFFLTNIEWAWEDESTAKSFLYHLLACRILFDKYIIKREFARDYKDQGKWSLQRLEKYGHGSEAKPAFYSTYPEKENKVLRTLQSCLRITYTSPKTMHWISLILRTMLDDEDSNLIEVLEDYCMKKVEASRYLKASGFGYERIVFTYLDYKLYRNGYSYKGKTIIKKQLEDFQFQFRTSIEHFFPQNPTEWESWNRESLDDFGNLALITVSSNSQFSNLPPEAKITAHGKMMDQSLKLRIMKHITLQEGWTPDKAEAHKNEMFRILL